ncbi:hypothetical protein JTB14_025320 [Gonioctena quinquepunctata]|nr:hypothetical protein JTB14_025320 [Gonioctena quinquepunctata]
MERIQLVTNLVAMEPRYHLFFQKRLYNRVPSGQKRVYRPATNVDEAMKYIFTYLTGNSKQCKFSLNELTDQIEGEYHPDIRTVKSLFLQNYREDILILEINYQSPVLCFWDTGYKILTENWYTVKN